MGRHSTRRKRSNPKPKAKKIISLPVINHYQPQTKCELILSDLGYDSKDFKLKNKSIDNLRFIQISTGKILDIRI